MDSAYKVFYALILTGIAAAGKVLLDLIPVLDKDPRFGSYAHVGAVAVMGFMFFHSQNIAKLMLAVLAPLRRLLAWTNYIEGDWPLVVVDCRDGSLVYYGFLKIAFEKGYLAVSGDDWHPDGTHALGFGSMQTYSQDHTLHYWYMQGERGLQRGYTFIEFFPRRRVPTHMTGVFHDKGHPDVRFYGRKYRYKWFERRRRTMEQRRMAAKAFADEIMPRVPVLLKGGVDTDWE